MQISKISFVSPKFGMAKSEEYERPKYWHHIKAEESVPASNDWFEHKQAMVDLITKQLYADTGLTEAEREDLGRDRFLLETDIHNKKMKQMIYG